jgi:hypothetical protein
MGPRDFTENPAAQYQIPIEPPGPERLFRLESEGTLMERMRQEARGRSPMERISFPDEPILSRDTYHGRYFGRQCELVEPNYVCYERLLFEQKNFERYGWDLGPLSPFVCLSEFFIDSAMLPYNTWKDPCRRFECSAGYCLPGDPVPLMIYPPTLSLAGGLAEASTALAIIAIFP